MNASDEESNTVIESELSSDKYFEEADHDEPACHPSPPPDEVFNVLTTIDPCYIISSIRKLIPPDFNGETAVEKRKYSIICKHQEPREFFSIRNEDNDPQTTIVEVLNRDQSTRVCGESKDSSCVMTGRASTIDEIWEEFGCILWDLAANKMHAELMVKNLIIDVLVANLLVSQSLRVKEICLGIIGNLACHGVPLKYVSSNCTLEQIIVEQLFVDDTRCLTETSRILASALQSSDSKPWVDAICSEHTLFRAIWIMENTLNPMLLERSIELLLAILENQDKVPDLLTLLMKLDLPILLINLLGDEMRHLASDRLTERISVLDAILRAIEALSVIDSFSEVVFSNQKLSELLVGIIKLPEKFEVASSCVTAVVLVANILSDVRDLVMTLFVDLTFIQGLLEIFPLASRDSAARSAIWSVLARLFHQVIAQELKPYTLHQYVKILSSTSELILDELLNEQPISCDEPFRCSSSFFITRQARSVVLQKIEDMLNEWLKYRDYTGEEAHKVNHNDDANIAQLLDCCRQYII